MSEKLLCSMLPTAEPQASDSWLWEAAGCREQGGSELVFQRSSDVMKGVFLRAVSSHLGAGHCCLPQNLAHPHVASRVFKKPGEGHFGRSTSNKEEMALYCKTVC